MAGGNAVNRIIKELMDYHVLRTPSTTDIASRWSITCSKCEEEKTYGWSADQPTHITIKSLRNAGWLVSRKSKPICFRCKRKAKEMGQVMSVQTKAIGADAKIARRIYGFLDEHFSEETHMYDTGWSDDRISKEADASLDMRSSAARLMASWP